MRSRWFVTPLLVVCLFAQVSCQTTPQPISLPSPPDLSLTVPPEYPGYFLIHESDLERLLIRAEVAEEKLRILYEEEGVGGP